MTTQRERRDLTIDEVVDCAIDIAQREGERGLTMRRVAEACNVTPMALYHHVENKEALLTEVVDRVVAEAIAATERTEVRGRDALVAFACNYRAGFVNHPTAAQVLLRRPVVSPAQARCTELMFEAFDQMGLVGPRLAEATDAVVLLMMGSIANDLTRPPEVRDQLVEQLPDDAAPLLRAGLATYSKRDGEQRFRLALEWLIDGLLVVATP